MGELANKALLRSPTRRVASGVKMNIRNAYQTRAGMLASLLASHGNYIGNAAIAVLAILTAFSLAGAFYRVILHGDGAYFTYVIAAGDSWGLKWGALSTRGATYVFAILPSETISHVFNFSGRQIATIYSFIFYAIPAVQFGIVVYLAWNRFRHLLFYPVVQFAISTGIAIGYPSEMVLAPGFFWICMFAILCRPVPIILLSLSFVGLIFSHELALLGVIIVAVFFFKEYRQSEDRLGLGALSVSLFTILGVAAFLLWLYLRLNGGGEGANCTAIYVFDPRRLIANASMWMVACALLASLAVHRFVKRELPPAWHKIFAAICLVATLTGGYWLNYASGRYESSRTLMGMAILVLGVLFMAQHLYPSKDVPAPSHRLSQLLKMSLSGMLAVNFMAAFVFLWDWDIARTSFEKAANGAVATKEIRFVDFNDAGSLLGIDGVIANENMNFSWTWPYRSIVVADGYRPHHIIVASEAMYALCPQLALTPGSRSQIPAEVTDALKQFACAQPAPPARRYLKDRLWDWLRGIF